MLCVVAWYPVAMESPMTPIRHSPVPARAFARALRAYFQFAPVSPYSPVFGL